MSKVALITGITGQDGSYLAEFLLKKHRKKTTKKIFAFNTSWNQYWNIATTNCI